MAKNGIITDFFHTFVQTIYNSDARMRLRYIILPVLMMSIIAPAQGQTSAGSSIASRTLLISDGTKKIEQRVYDNGLGDVIQEVQSYTGSSLSSVVVHHEYDEYRRRTKSWLPVTFSSGNGFIAGSTIASQAVSQYSDSAPFSRTEYDRFLPSQPSAEYKAGALWQNNDKKVNITYSEYVGAGLYAYTDGCLYKLQSRKYLCTLTSDEDTCLSAEYTDLNGRLLISETSQGKTYYIYNPKGDITYVIPPILSEYIISNFGPKPDYIPDTDGMMQKYAYVYRYDDQRHCIYKKLPGCEPIYYVYDKAGNCILTQDGCQRQDGVWAYSIPDKFGRPCISGICHNSISYSAEPLHSVFVYAEYSGTYSDTGGYTVNNLSLSNQTLYTAAYYDDYSFIGQHGVPSTLTASGISGFSIDTSLGHGLQTGSATAVLNDCSVIGYTYSAMYYDSRYNVSQAKSTNHLGSNDITCTSYSYTGKPLSVKTLHMMEGNDMMEGNETYTYDDADRVDSFTVSVTHGNPAVSVTMTHEYDDLGRLSSIRRQSKLSTTLDVNYSYELHGWLKGITTNKFCEELFYADGVGTPCYNGNISSIKWRHSKYDTKQGYKYTYDNANRLTQATFGTGDAIANSQMFSESVQYDAHGNVTGITRRGMISSNSYGPMDNLTLSYDGNQLTGVSETVADHNYTGSFEYKRDKGSQYMYDNNGSLVADKSRGIAYITYDLNNQPSVIYFTNGSETRYVFSASGEKLRVAHYTAKPNITRPFGVRPADLTPSQTLYKDSTDYLLGGSLVMKNGKIDKFLFHGGYALASPSSPTADTFSFRYYNQDHLGNNREVFGMRSNTCQIADYYPFGILFSETITETHPDYQPYKYNGKELDRMHGLDNYDYGARQYDPILARWDRMDPLCEKNPDITPYHFCHNNPVNKIDPNGKDDYYTRDGTYLGTNKAITDNIYITGEDQYRKLEDGKYAINMSSRVAINDTELDAEAYSKIFTNSLRLGGYNTSNLSGGKIQVTVWHMEGGSKVSDNYTENASSVGSALATTNSDHDNGARITAYIWPQGTEERELFSTRSNIISCIGDHEFKGHYQLGYKHEENTSDRIYRMQKNSPNWNKTTIQFKNYINKIIKDNGWE